MASTSGHRAHNSSVSSRIATAATTISSDNQPLIADIRKALIMMKGIAVELEKEHQSDQIKGLEGAFLELLETYDDCTRFSEVVQKIGGGYQPCDQILEREIVNSKATSRSVPQSNPLYRQFKEAIWNVHHAGQPMPGEEQEDIVMTSTQTNLLNITCPLTGKPVTELQNPVRYMDCKHIYEKDPILQYIRKKKPQPNCPVAGCPKILQVGRMVCDSLLLVEIEVMRTQENPAANATNVEDFTEID